MKVTEGKRRPSETRTENKVWKLEKFSHSFIFPFHFYPDPKNRINFQTDPDQSRTGQVQNRTRVEPDQESYLPEGSSSDHLQHLEVVSLQPHVLHPAGERLHCRHTNTRRTSEVLENTAPTEPTRSGGAGAPQTAGPEASLIHLIWDQIYLGRSEAEPRIETTEPEPEPGAGRTPDRFWRTSQTDPIQIQSFYPLQRRISAASPWQHVMEPPFVFRLKTFSETSAFPRRPAARFYSSSAGRSG